MHLIWRGEERFSRTSVKGAEQVSPLRPQPGNRKSDEKNKMIMRRKQAAGPTDVLTRNGAP